MINKNVKFYLASNSLYYGSFDVINAFLSVLVTNKVTGGNLEIMGLILGYNMLLRAFVELILIKIIKIKQKTVQKNVVAISYVVYGLLVVALGFSSTILHVFLIQTFLALIDALAYPMKWSIFSIILDKNNAEQEWGLEDIISTAVSAVFAALGGILSQQFGLESIFVIFGLLYFFSGLFFFPIKVSDESIGIKN